MTIKAAFKFLKSRSEFHKRQVRVKKLLESSLGFVASRGYAFPILFRALVKSMFEIGNNTLSPEIPTTKMSDSGCEST